MIMHDCLFEETSSQTQTQIMFYITNEYVIPFTHSCVLIDLIKRIECE